MGTWSNLSFFSLDSDALKRFKCISQPKYCWKKLCSLFSFHEKCNVGNGKELFPSWAGGEDGFLYLSSLGLAPENGLLHPKLRQKGNYTLFSGNNFAAWVSERGLKIVSVMENKSDI